MSKILAALAEAAVTTQKRGENVVDFVTRLVPIISELDDAAWNKIPETAQDYYNDAADAINASKTPVEPPDVEKVAETVAPSRRRGGGANSAAIAAADVKPYLPAVGDEVEATNRRNKKTVGKIVEVADGVVVIDDGNTEVEVLTEGATFVLLGNKAVSSEPATPSVGAKVILVNARDKQFIGVIVDLTADLVVLDVGGAEQEFPISRVKSMQVVAPGTGASVPPPAPAPAAAETTTRRRGAAATPAPAAPAADAASTRASKASNGGVSVTTRIREMVADDLAATAEDIGKALRKEGLEFRDNTLSLTYAETHKVVSILKAAGKLKG